MSATEKRVKVIEGEALATMERDFEQLRMAVEQSGRKRSALAEAAGFGKSLMTNFMKGRSNLGPDNYNALCRTLGISFPRRVEKIVPTNDSTEETASFSKVPILGLIRTGLAGDNMVCISGESGDALYVTIATSELGDLRCLGGEVVGIKIDGFLLAPNYLAGDIILLEKCSNESYLRDGDHVVVRLGDKYVFKVYRSDERVLTSLNPGGPVFNLVWHRDVVFFGRVCYLIRKIK